MFRAHSPFHKKEASGHLSPHNWEVTLVVIINCVFVHQLAGPQDFELPEGSGLDNQGQTCCSLSYLSPTEVSALAEGPPPLQGSLSQGLTGWNSPSHFSHVSRNPQATEGSPVFKCWLCFLAVCLWASYQTSLGLSFLTLNRDNNTSLTVLLG